MNPEGESGDAAQPVPGREFGAASPLAPATNETSLPSVAERRVQEFPARAFCTKSENGRRSDTDAPESAENDSQAMMAMTSDEKLMLEFQQGSQEAFTELFARYRQPIYGFFRRRLDDAARAEELAQESFVAMLRGAARYEPRALFRTYLYGIALNLLAAERRKASREAPRANGPAEAADPPAPGEDPEAALWVRRAVAQLEPMDREVLMLREYEQLSYEEIAGVLRVPVNTVRSRLFRARLALRDLLLPQRQGTSGRKPA